MTKSWRVAIYAVPLLLAPGVLVAQMRSLQPVGVEGPGVQALAAQVAQLKQDMANQKAAFGQELFAARFRITALELNQKQGGTTAQLKQQIDSQAAANAELSARLSALSSRFEGHSHTYDRTSFGLNRIGGSLNITDLHMAQAAKTSPPN